MQSSTNLGLNIFDGSDRASRDKFNENFNIVDALFGDDVIEDAFNSVFGNTAEIDPTAMTSSEITDAINTEWNGESSDDPTAMSATEVEDSLNTEWNGESSDDPTAMTKEEVNEATTL